VSPCKISVKLDYLRLSYSELISRCPSFWLFEKSVLGLHTLRDLAVDTCTKFGEENGGFELMLLI